jgi:hypothetical protein
MPDELQNPHWLSSPQVQREERDQPAIRRIAADRGRRPARRSERRHQAVSHPG